MWKLWRSVNPEEYMLEIHSVTEEEEVDCAESESFSELDVNSDPLKTKRKVQFSWPLEYWREFDKETGEVYELKDETTQEVADSLPKPSENIKTKNIDVPNLKSDQRLDWKNSAKAQSITDVFQVFQKRDYKKANTFKQIKDKRDNPECKKSFIKRNLTTYPSTSLHTKQLKPGSLLCKVSTCSKLAHKGEFTFNARSKEPSLIQSHCTYSFSSSLGMLTGVTVPSQPLVCTGRKLYDERLLPAVERERKYSSMYTSKNNNGLPPLTCGKPTTPDIVQLFD